jgi:hypothetical protein
MNGVGFKVLADAHGIRKAPLAGSDRCRIRVEIRNEEV